MLVIYTILFALVQAVTEFLPVSSSGHLILLHNILNIEMIDSLSFDVALHVGTAFALVAYFWKDIKRYFIAFMHLFTKFNIARDEQKTVISLILATIPAALVGFFLESYIEIHLRNSLVVALSLIVGGIIFFVVERYSRQQRSYEALSIPEAFMIGIVQVLALIPGVSRSGSTIVTGMVLNLKREDAARFSFLLGIPVVLGAGLKKGLDLDLQIISSQELYLMLLGGIVSMVVGYVVIKYFLRFLQKSSLNIFGVYRIILGLIILLFVWL